MVAISPATAPFLLLVSPHPSPDNGSGSHGKPATAFLDSEAPGCHSWQLNRVPESEWTWTRGTVTDRQAQINREERRVRNDWQRLGTNLCFRFISSQMHILYSPAVGSHWGTVALPPPFLWPWYPGTKCPLWARKLFGSRPQEPSSRAFPPWCCACSALE